MSRYKGIPKYNGELDDIDPIEFGIQLRKDNKDCYDRNNVPSSKFSGGTDDNPCWKFLDDWTENVQKGWRREDYRISKALFDKQLVEFKKTIPSVGEEVYIEHPTNQGTYFKCRIEFIPEEKDKVFNPIFRKRQFIIWTISTFFMHLWLFI